MEKDEIRQTLYSLTPTEQSLLSNPSNLTVYDYPLFDFFFDQQNQKIYKYTFEEHFKLALKRSPHLTRYLEKPPLIIFKHARFSYTPYHIHDFVELNYVYKGSIKIIINDKTVVLNEGDVCLLDTGVSHRILDTGKNDILINVLINKDYSLIELLNNLRSNSIISKFLVDSLSETQNHNQYILFFTQKSKFLLDAVEGMLSNYLDPRLYSKETINAYLTIIFSELLKAHEKERSINYQKSRETYIVDILEYIEKNHDNCTLEDLARKFGYNTSYLSRYIKKHTGKTFTSFIQEIRLRKACSMLKNSTISIEVISQETGYKNISFFYKKFKELTGMSPKEYREAYSSINS